MPCRKYDHTHAYMFITKNTPIHIWFRYVLKHWINSDGTIINAFFEISFGSLS